MNNIQLNSQSFYQILYFFISHLENKPLSKINSNLIRNNTHTL